MRNLDWDQFCRSWYMLAFQAREHTDGIVLKLLVSFRPWLLRRYMLAFQVREHKRLNSS